MASRDLKLANMEVWLAQADRKLDETSRRSELARRSDETVFRSMREAVVSASRKADNATDEIQQLAVQQARLKEDLEKFFRQLPTGKTILNNK